MWRGSPSFLSQLGPSRGPSQDSCSTWSPAMRQSAPSLLLFSPSSTYSPQSSHTDCKTKTRSGCSSVQNPLWASQLPFCKTQSYPRPTKSGTVCIPASLIRPTTLPWAYSTSAPQHSPVSKLFVPALHSAWKAHLPDSLRELSLASFRCLFNCPFIKEAFHNHPYHTHTHTSLAHYSTFSSQHLSPSDTF